MLDPLIHPAQMHIQHDVRRSAFTSYYYSTGIYYVLDQNHGLLKLIIASSFVSRLHHCDSDCLTPAHPVCQGDHKQ